MPHFGLRSRAQLLTAHPDLQKLFNEVIKHYDCSVTEGHRSKQDQDRYFRDGTSQVQWPNSKHNQTPSLAVDVYPYPINFKQTERFYHFAGFVLGTAKMMGIPIRWGGDWDQDNDLYDSRFMDLPHFELDCRAEAGVPDGVTDV